MKNKESFEKRNATKGEGKHDSLNPIETLGRLGSKECRI
jgi:hypothetical protein